MATNNKNLESAEPSRESLERENLIISNKKMISEIDKIDLEIHKIMMEILSYPIVVGSGLAMAFAAVYQLFFQ